MKSCCEHFADTLPYGCRQGRDCPEHTRRTQESEYLWTRNLDQCARSGQVDSRQIAAHIAAGELDGIGNECALPIIVDDIKPAREPVDGQTVVIALAVAFTWIAVLYLSTADPRDLSTLWPRVLALLSF